MKSLNYKDIHLIPNYSTLASREQADTSVQFGKFKFNLPVVPANMVTTIDFEKAKLLSENDYFYILHRFYDYVELLEWMTSSTLPFLSISIGIKDRDIELMREAIVERGIQIDYVTVDVAHGDHSQAIKTLEFLNELKQSHTPDMFIIGGNVATASGFIRLSTLVDAVKVGIGPGSSCITYNKTGFLSPMFSAVNEIAVAKEELDRDVQIIADGGISNNGDIAKALVAGANMVMVGAGFAQCIDSPALVDPKDPTKILYFGSASRMNGNSKNIEGKTVSLPMNGMSYDEKLVEIKQDLGSAISYAGGENLKAFKEVAWSVF
jgi:GMP reductase